ncbi:MAG: hypothetical protein KDJ19_13580 [Hyphomicrobiaceae bacterium]|nr:hypothetical protein [Hyphomicrobiaceae bacterium]MCC0023941.1 hypothetical protein [Hyphomicrobiaceae bacterium]
MALQAADNGLVVDPHQSAASRGRLYSRLLWRNRLIGFLRWAVPLLGLALAGFLIGSIIIANLAKDYGIKRLRLEDDKIVVDTPEYSGVMSDGTTYSVVAEAAKIQIDDTDIIDLETATIKTEDKRDYSLTARSDFAVLDLKEQTVTVPDLMRTVDSDGVRGWLHQALIEWRDQTLTSSGDVRFKFPDGGDINAASLKYDADKDIWNFRQAVYRTPSQATETENAGAGGGAETAAPESDTGEDDTVYDVVTGDRLVVREKPNNATFTGNVVVTRPDLTVWADEILVQFAAARMQDPSLFTATGNVKLKDDVQTVTGDSGVYDPNTKIMHVTGDVAVKTDSGLVKAPELTSNLETHVSEFTTGGSGKVSGDFHSEDDVKVVSDRFVVRRDDNVAEFIGNVIVDQNKLRVFADRVVVYLAEGGSDEIRYYEAFGNVVIKEPDQTSTGDRGHYDPNTRIMRLTGNVKVTNKSGTVDASQLVVNLKTNVSTFTASGENRVTGVFRSNDNGGNSGGLFSSQDGSGQSGGGGGSDAPLDL